MSAETRERILAYAHARPGIALRDFLRQTADFASPDDVYHLIAAGRLYVDLYAAPLIEPATVRVFPNQDAAPLPATALEKRCEPPLQSFRPGTTLVWDSRSWQVANVGQAKISLLGEDGSLMELPPTAVESLVREGRITQLPAEREADHDPGVSGELFHASEQDLRIANHRAEVGWATVRVNPSFKRKPDKGCWVTLCPLPISREGNVQLHKSRGQDHRQAIVRNQPVDHWDSVELWYYQTASLSHQLTGGSHPGGASSGVWL